MPTDVNAWVETVLIPTYRIGAPDKNPMFLEKRVYQGSSGAVYPHPVIDSIYDEKEDKAYTALFLENRYLKLMILPEIGGRLQMALDKTNNYHFIYYNQVIKPALVGLTGPWISGGIEFNWPQHHRPSTFEPLDWRIEEHSDGSKTVWCGEIERMYRTKGLHGFRLYPGKAFIEIQVQLYNRTPVPQTFLWWANPAVAVHDDYQSVFPPDVHAVMDHGKRDVSTFPIATGTYYKVNYAPGTDISRYKNIPVPTSYMAYHSDFDFMGSYDHRAQAGMLHVADHHIVPGKKQWTWGNGDFGRAWDRQLTDTDGPYIELMCGAYTDNQPDFSWIQPGEEKTFTQIFMPYKKIGPPCNANQDVALSLQVTGDKAQIGVYSSSARTITARLNRQGHPLYERQLALDPDIVLLDEVSLPAGTLPQDLSVDILEGETYLLSYSPSPETKPDIPAPAVAARPPAEIESNEELYLNGLHLEQYRHATYAPENYYLEALRRDPGDSRCNNSLGLLLFRRGQFAQAEKHFRAAIQRLTLRNPNPYDGEAYYNLGLALKMQGQHTKAFDAFFKAAWNAAWQDSSYFELARLASRAGKLTQALDFTERCLRRNARHIQARQLKIALLRHLVQTEAAQSEAKLAIDQDPLDYGALYELSLLENDRTIDQVIQPLSGIRIELALDYAHAGLYPEAITLLESQARDDPMAAYTLGWVHEQAGQLETALEEYRQAADLSCDFCFPNRLEDILILKAALVANPLDGRAGYYLGNFWYAHRQYEEAIACWEKAADLGAPIATVHRNLGLAYFNQHLDPSKSLAHFEQAFALNPSDGRVFFELDQLYKRLNFPPQKRLDNIDRYPDLVAQRDDLAIERITLLNVLGQPEQAYQALMARNFHPWEGGEGKVIGQYVTSLVQIARKQLRNREGAQAVELLTRAQSYPPNLGEGKLYGTQENNIIYYLGCAYEILGQPDLAENAFMRASSGLSDPTSPRYYNDQPPDMIFYQGLALLKLGRELPAHTVFQILVDYGSAHMQDEVIMDYFAVSLPDFLVFDVDLNERNRLHCHYLQGLGYLGLGDRSSARSHFEAALALDPSHLGSNLHLSMI